MEELNQGWGSMVYVTTLPEIDSPSVLTLNDCHDFAQVFIDTTYVGKIDRVRNEKSLLLPAVKKGQELKILIEAMGRINFGRAIKDYKGITESVTLSTDRDGHELIWNLKRWNIFTIPDSYDAAKKALDTAKCDSLTKMMFKGSGYYRGYFNLKKVGDTFLNMEAFGKGQVYVNGHAVGRFWSIGPQQTLYVPGCWLKKGKNEVIVLDVVGPSVKAYYFTKDKKRLSPWLFAQNHPELDLLNVEKSRTHNNPGDKPDLNSATPLSAGTLAAGNGWQMVRFDKPKTGRYLAIQALSTYDGKDVVSVAELYAINANGGRLSRESWTVKYADSEETKRGNNTAEKSFDLQESTYWRTEKGVALPHLVVIDLGSEQTIIGIDYLPRMEEGAPGSIKDYKIFVY
jgi:beta-galactosidase